PPRFLFGTEIPTRLKLEHAVYRDCLVAGRFLRPSDADTFNIVISRQISEEHDKRVGDHLDVNGRPMKIVGIYHCGSLLLDITIIADIGTVSTMTRFDPASVSCYYVEPRT